MKNITLTLSAMLFAATVFGGDKVPKVVKDAFAKAWPKVEKVSWDNEEGKFEAKFKYDKMEYSATYNADGSLIETEILLKESQLPKAVNASAHKAHPTAKFKEFAKITRANGTIVYEVEIKENGKETDLYFTPDGAETK